jgi:hypothetical protein
MKTNAVRMLIMGVSLLLIGGAPALVLAAETEQKAQPPAKAETGEKKEEATKEAPESSKAPEAAEKPAATKRPAGLVGTIVAVVPQSRTLVVDVPRGKEVLRVGAEVTNRTRIMERGKNTSLAALREGQRVRINFRRIATGDEALSVDVLRAAKG